VTSTIARTVSLVAFLFVVAIASARAEHNGFGPSEGSLFLNTGVRFSWDSHSGDFVFGLETSLTRFGIVSHGGVIAVDFPADRIRWHFGYQVATAYMLGGGIETGPTFSTSAGENAAGWHLNLFALAIVVPYTQLTFMPSGPEQEAGLMLKYPVMVSPG
jgi:hypothetical protein